jgi:hypothetical protein
VRIGLPIVLDSTIETLHPQLNTAYGVSLKCLLSRVIEAGTVDEFKLFFK